MLKFRFKEAKWLIDSNGIWLNLKVPNELRGKVQEFILGLNNNDKVYEAKIDKYREKRSLDANAYMWTILRAMAEKLNTTDKEIYREMIRRVGQTVIVPIKNEAIETYTRRWEANGEGWQVDVMGPCRKIEGYSNLRCYYGSSVYDTKEMSILLDEIVSEAKELGIDTITPDELERMKGAWGNAK
jgi:hypothetical protein